MPLVSIKFLGGALASLVGLTNLVPVMTFEAPGDLLYAQRIGLVPQFPNNSTEYYEFMEKMPIYHFGNNGDPIYMGECQGMLVG